MALERRYNVSSDSSTGLSSGSSSTSNDNGLYTIRRSDIRVKKFSTGGSSTCAITVDGELKCWGSDRFGELGNDFGDPPNSGNNVDLQPGVSVDLGEGRTAVAVAAGHSACVVRSVLVKSRMLEKLSIVPLSHIIT